MTARAIRPPGPSAASSAPDSTSPTEGDRQRRLPSRLAALLLMAAGLAVFVIISRRLSPFMADDVFISLRYGRHLLEGKGLVYNLGERVEGYTNFLWTMLAAPSVIAPIGVFPYIRLLNGLFAVLAAWQAGLLVARLARATSANRTEAKGEPFTWTAVGASMFLLTPAVIVSCAEGLETMLFTLLLVTGANRLMSDSDEEPVPRAGLVFAALALTRPDGIVFVAWGVLAAAWLGRSRRYVSLLALTAFGLWVAYWAARWAWYGQPLPNTFYAKGTGGSYMLKRGWAELREFVNVMGGPVLALALIPLFRRGRRLALVLVAAIVLRVAFQLWSGGPALGRYRFMIPVTPFLQALLVAGVAGWARANRTRLVLACAVAALALAPAWLGYPNEEASALTYAAGLQRAHGRLGQDLLEHTTPGAVIAMDDAGLAPLECDRTNVDMLGLNDLHIAHLPGRYGTKVDVPYVLGRHPDVVVLLSQVEHPTRDEDFWLSPNAALYRDPAFRSGYGYSRRYYCYAGYYLLVFRKKGSAEAPAGYWGGEGSVEPKD